MAPTSLLDLVQALPATDSWGPSVTTETIRDGVPYAPFSKGDKLGRMADWTADGKNQERGGRQQYNRNYRGTGYTLSLNGNTILCHAMLCYALLALGIAVVGK